MPKIKSSQVFDFGASPAVMENLCRYLLAQATSPTKTQERRLRSKAPKSTTQTRCSKKNNQNLFKSKLQ